MRTLFLDTNVILDYIARRDNCEYMDVLIQMSLDRGDVLCTSLLSFANMAYIMRKHTHEERVQVFRILRRFIRVISADEKQFDQALDRKVTDFEDYLQYQAAISYGCSHIITNNGKHFEEFSELPVLDAKEYVIYSQTLNTEE